MSHYNLRVSNASSFAPNNRQLSVRVELECGHTIKLRLRPITFQARFGCPMGTGCGYHLRWVSWQEGKVIGINKKYAKEKDR